MEIGISRLNIRVLNLRFWCGGWEEGSKENGDGILSTNKQLNLKGKSK